MIVSNPAVFLASAEWIIRFGRVRVFRDEDWGRLLSNPKLPKAALEFFKEQGAKGGRKGGSLGGKTGAANMTAAQRKERAAKAVAAREAKRKLQAHS